MSILKKIKQIMLGTEEIADLPSPIQSALAKQQLESEKLVSWVLLILITIIFLLSIFVPNHPRSHNHIVYAAISIYFLFALVRIISIYFKSLPEWFFIASAMFDVLILFSLVWSIHVVYSEPPSIYLKVPFVSYIYILLALRVLRFDPKYVLTVGITAVILYIFLLVYALEFSPPGMRTKEYVDYLKSDHIYLAGEGNKILTLFIVTIILTLGMVRGRLLLARSIRETRARNELSRFFEPEIASHIIESSDELKPGFGKQTQAAILDCDIRGFTEISKKCLPSTVMHILTEYQSLIVKASSQRNGSIDKFLGDGVLISFNAVTKHEDTYASDALHTALLISEASHYWQQTRKRAGFEELKMAMAVTSGLVTVGIVGDITRLEYTVIGDAVNLSAKLEKHCKVENCEVITTLTTYHLAVKQGFNYQGNIKIRYAANVQGLPEPIDLVILK